MQISKVKESDKKCQDLHEAWMDLSWSIHPSTKLCGILFSSYCVILMTNKNNQLIDMSENIESLKEVFMQIFLKINGTEREWSKGKRNVQNRGL